MALIDNCIAYYKFEETEGSTVEDELNTYDGTNVGATINQTGKINQCYNYDGTNDYVHIPDGVVGLSVFTISFWLNIDALGGENNVIIGQWDDYGDNKRSWMLNIDSAGTGTFHESSDGGGAGYKSLSCTGNLSEDTWYHILITKDGADVVVYKDGASWGSSSSMNATLYNYPGTTKIATSDGAFGAAPSFVDCLFDELGIWTRELTGVEITALYNSGAGLAYPFTVPKVPRHGFVNFQDPGMV